MELDKLLIIIIVVIFILLVIYFILYSNSTYLEFFQNNDSKKPILWSYWELKSGIKKPPDYINLCFKTFKYKCSELFDIKILDEKTVYDYIPNLRKDLNQLNLAAKSDYIRVALLYNYGGVWLDADTIVMTNLSEIINRLNEGWDYIGFGCTGPKCITSGYPKPSNGAMASQKGSVLMKNVLIELDRELDAYFSKNRKNFGYFDLGKIIIWKEIDKLINSHNYKYYHFPSYVDGSRDINGNWIAPDLIFEKNIELDQNTLMIVFLANSIYCGVDTKYNWFCNLSENKILNGPYYISSLFRKSLDYKPDRNI